MPYILNKTNGTILTTVQDATVDNTTSLTFLGKNFTGYGQSVEENFVHLLENFSNDSSPDQAITGQLWFNTFTNQLNVTSDGMNWKGIGSITIGSTATHNTSPSVGDFWWDGDLSQLIVYDGTKYINVGPSNTSSYGSWLVTGIENSYSEKVSTVVGTLLDNTGQYYSTGTVISEVAFTTKSTSPYHSRFPVIQRGINLAGADPNLSAGNITPPVLVGGSSISSGRYFWGTAAESLATVAVELVSSNNTSNCLIPFAARGTNTATNLVTTSSFYINPVSGVLNATATSAFYADIAERYEADAVYEPGTVLVIGGEKEVTVTSQFADTRVAGIVSKNPAYMMNSEAGSDETHPYIALKGRVPCKVIGPINKGDLIVTSNTPGYAVAAVNVFGGAIIGKALGSQSEGFGVIEILVV